MCFSRPEILCSDVIGVRMMEERHLKQYRHLDKRERKSVSMSVSLGQQSDDEPAGDTLGGDIEMQNL